MDGRVCGDGARVFEGAEADAGFDLEHRGCDGIPRGRGRGMDKQDTSHAHQCCPVASQFGGVFHGDFMMS